MRPNVAAFVARFTENHSKTSTFLKSSWNKAANHQQCKWSTPVPSTSKIVWIIETCPQHRESRAAAYTTRWHVSCKYLCLPKIIHSAQSTPPPGSQMVEPQASCHLKSAFHAKTPERAYSRYGYSAKSLIYTPVTCKQAPQGPQV